jgi:hypothetical protein
MRRRSAAPSPFTSASSQRSVSVIAGTPVMSIGSAKMPRPSLGGDEDAAVGGHDADEVGEAVAVDVGELDAGVAEAQARGWRGDGVGGLVTGGVVVAQPEPAVGVVVAQDVDAAVEVEVDERDVRGGEVEAEVEVDLRGGANGVRAAGVGPQLALAGLREDVLHAVAGEVGEAGGLVESDGGRGIGCQVAERSVPRPLR